MRDVFATDCCGRQSQARVIHIVYADSGSGRTVNIENIGIICRSGHVRGLSRNALINQAPSIVFPSSNDPSVAAR